MSQENRSGVRSEINENLFTDPISTNPKRRRESPSRPLKLAKEVVDPVIIHGAENGAELSLRASAAAAAAHDVVYQSYYPGLQQHEPQLHYSHQHAIENWPPEAQTEEERASAAAGGVLIVVSSNSALPKEDYNYSSPAIYTSPADNVSKELAGSLDQLINPLPPFQVGPVTKVLQQPYPTTDLLLQPNGNGEYVDHSQIFHHQHFNQFNQF